MYTRGTHTCTSATCIQVSVTLVYIFIRTAGQVCVYKTIEVPIYVYKRHTYMHTYMRDTYTAHMNVLVYEEER